MSRTNLDEGPYCSHCGYSLVGATESARCPECGKPLVEVLMRPQMMRAGKRYRSKATLFGLPVIDVAIGPHGKEKRGRARGIIAIGDIATGWLAIGGVCLGVVSIGGIAVGLLSLGGLAIGLIAALGGDAIGGLAAGGMALGVVAMGGIAVGLLASGGLAVGVVAQGGVALGQFVRSGRSGVRWDPIFDQWAWLLGGWPPGAGPLLRFILLIVLMIVATASVIGVIALWRLKREPA